MLNDFSKLKKGDVIIQNGANSGVGQAVIQIAKILDLKSINIIRPRKNDSEQNELNDHLTRLGANLVVTEDKVRLPETQKLINELGESPKLGFNCVGGKSATNMSRLLG